MPVRDLRPGRASIAARGASQPARASRLTSPRVGVLRDIIDSVFCSLLLPTILRRAKRPDATRRNAPYTANGKRFIERWFLYRISMKFIIAFLAPVTFMFNRKRINCF